MTKNCTPFPARDLSQPVYVTVNLTMPLLFGLSVVGLLLCLVVLNARCVRKLSPLFAYLTGAIFMDLLAVFCIVPEAVRDSEVLPPRVSYSYEAAHVYYFANGLRDTFLHSSVWMTSFMTCARIVDVTWPDNKFRCTRISASRIIAFVLFIFCGVINFPRYFEVAVAEVKGHCYEGRSLWHLESTFFGRYHLYDHNAFYPWMTVSILYGFPLFLLLAATLVLVAKVGCLRLVRAKIACVTPRLQDEEDELQTSYLVIILSLLMLLGQSPHALSQFSRAGNDTILGPAAARNIRALSFCLVLLRCSLIFPICCLFSSNFRTALQRCFCCVCAYDDEYHEPGALTRCCCRGRKVKGKVRANGHYYYDDHARDVGDDDDDAYSVEKINERLEESRSRLSRADSVDVWI